MSTLSSINPYSASGYDYAGTTPAASASVTNTQSSNALATQDSVELQSDASLINSIFPQSNPSASSFCKLSHKHRTGGAGRGDFDKRPRSCSNDFPRVKLSGYGAAHGRFAGSSDDGKRFPDRFVANFGYLRDASPAGCRECQCIHEQPFHGASAAASLRSRIKHSPGGISG